MTECPAGCDELPPVTHCAKCWPPDGLVAVTIDGHMKCVRLSSLRVGARLVGLMTGVGWIAT